MRLLTRLLLAAACLATTHGATFSYHVTSEDPGAWPAILESIGLTKSNTGVNSVFVVRRSSPLTGAQWLERVKQGAFLIVESDSPVGRELGFAPTSGKRVMVRSVVDVHAPEAEIVWEKDLELPLFSVPEGARVWATERWTQAPLVAGFRRGNGAVLWVGASPGKAGHEHFPFLAHAMADLGFEPPFRSAQLWAFFDGSYRSRVDLDYFAERWRKAGISALHVAAWHYYDADPERDAYLQQLIRACHQRAILVYAWLELPHVSEKFWSDHPEWREKTAIGQDAQLDWRKLINLTNREAFGAVSAGVKDLLTRFDWDGVNLAELYFESLEGYLNPARFTPMNADVRAEFQRAQGYDPIELFDPASARHPSKDATGMRALLEFRAELARRQQTEWIARIEAIRNTRPHLDVVLTHVDDRFDTRMRDLIGADASRVLPLLERHDFTFLVEDPATIWNLGPERYSRIAAAYQPITPKKEKLAIDINIVERYQDVYPTKQQTGTELFQLVHLSANSFPRVALYFENSIAAHDLPFVAAAASTVTGIEQSGGKLSIDSKSGIGVPWRGPALVDGRPWPVRSDDTLWLPAGAHTIEPGAGETAARITDINAALTTATATPRGIEISYRSDSRALARLDRQPRTIDIDGAASTPAFLEGALVLPKGQHIVTLTF